jgi:hypothetical protein
MASRKPTQQTSLYRLQSLPRMTRMAGSNTASGYRSGRRVGIDPSLYTWKGYRNWSEQVKRNWEPDAGDDTE